MKEIITASLFIVRHLSKDNFEILLDYKDDHFTIPQIIISSDTSDELIVNKFCSIIKEIGFGCIMTPSLQWEAKIKNDSIELCSRHLGMASLYQARLTENDEIDTNYNWYNLKVIMPRQSVILEASKEVWLRRGALGLNKPPYEYRLPLWSLSLWY